MDWEESAWREPMQNMQTPHRKAPPQKNPKQNKLYIFWVAVNPSLIAQRKQRSLRAEYECVICIDNHFFDVWDIIESLSQCFTFSLTRLLFSFGSLANFKWRLMAMRSFIPRSAPLLFPLFISQMPVLFPILFSISGLYRSISHLYNYQN